MNFKKVAALLLTGCLSFSLVACGGGKNTDTSSQASESTTAANASASENGTAAAGTASAGDVATPDWAPYDALIKSIKSEADMVKREKLMHEAEDMVMETGALLPIYYYNDVYMQKPNVQGIYTNVYGDKFFQFATVGDKDTMRINIASEPARLDPALNSSSDGGILAKMTFAGLYTFDENGKLMQDLAEDTKLSDDKLTYTFTLKDDLKWSDGSPLTAADFEYSWKRAAATETAADYSYLFEIIKGYPENLAVKASEDGKTLTVELAAPCAYFLDLVAFPVYLPVKQDQVESAEGFKDASGKIIDAGAWALEAGFVSNGPFVLDKWEHKESMTYKKNPNYHRADEVKLEQLDFMLSADQTAVYAAYQAGDLDFIDVIPADEMANVKKNPEFHKVDLLGTYYAVFNVKSSVFAGKTVEQANAMRRAFAHLVDRQYIVDTIAQAEQVIADSFVGIGISNGHGGEFKANSDAYKYPEGTGYFNPAEVDLDAARALLKEAGYKFDGDKLSAETPINLEYLTNTGDAHVKIAETMQADFAELGINLTIKSVEWDVFLETRKAGQYDFARNGWLCDYNDPVNLLEMWTTDSGNNDAQFGR